MSSNKTTNLQMHSWLPTDTFDVDEINENFSKLDDANADYVIERGSNTFWSWRKWKSGRCELDGRGTLTVESSDWQAYGTLSYKLCTSPAFPFTINYPTAIVTPYKNKTCYGMYFASVWPNDDTLVTFDLLSVRSEDTFEGTIMYTVNGWWN